MTSEGGVIELLRQLEANAWPDGAPPRDEWVTAFVNYTGATLVYGVVDHAWTNQDDGKTWVSWRQLEPPAHKLRTVALTDEGIVWIRGRHEAESEAIEAMRASRALVLPRRLRDR